MNTNEIIERLWADPEDTSGELVAALAGSPELITEQKAAREFNARLTQGMHAVNADAALRQKLLQLPEQAEHRAVADVSVVPAALVAGNDTFWRRILPVAACLILVVGLVIYFRPGLQVDLENEIFAHVYAEERFLNADTAIPLNEVNARMENVVGGHLRTSADTKKLDVTFAKDCWIAKGKAMHLIVKGQTGAVTMIMIPGSVTASEFNISDDRFRGVVSPTTGGGTLVVIGNKQEPIEEYRKLLSTNLDWEY